MSSIILNTYEDSFTARMTDTACMQLAIRQAKKSTELCRCGTVIVRSNQVLAQTYNTQRRDSNATAHAEIKAIAQAGRKLRQKNLRGCTVYSTCEPCLMCLTVLSFAKINKLVFGASLHDVSQNGAGIFLEEIMGKLPHRFSVKKNFLQDACMRLYPVKIKKRQARHR